MNTATPKGDNTTFSRRWLVIAVLVAAWLLLFPPIRLHRAATSTGSSMDAEAAALAAQARTRARDFWDNQLLPGIAQAADAQTVAIAIGRDAQHAAPQYGRRPGIGGRLYYFIRGEGRIARVDATGAWLEPVGGGVPIVLQLAAVFGNAVRDASGLADLRSMSSFEFNALSAALDALAEEQVQPALRAMKVGRSMRFAGCAVASRVGAEWVLKTVAIQAEDLQ